MQFKSENSVFSRAFWDNKFKSGPGVGDKFLMNYLRFTGKPKKVEGFKQKDYALRNAGWLLNNTLSKKVPGQIQGYSHLYTPLGSKNETKYSESKEELTKTLISAAKKLGANDIGFTKVNMEWHFSDSYMWETGSKPLPPQDIGNLNNCVVIAVDTDYDTVKTSPAATAGAEVGLGYSNSVIAVHNIMDFINGLGYNAFGSLNDTALCIPYGIAAGLGEYGRNGLMINEYYGPKVRIAKIFTDMPLVYSKEKKFGVEGLCNVCRKCSDSCPAKAIPHGEPTTNTHNISNIQGVKKWSVDAEKCFNFWTAMNTDCGICIRVCPFNKDMSKLSHRIYKKVIFNPLLKVKAYKLILWFENIFKFDKRTSPTDWWNKKE